MVEINVKSEIGELEGVILHTPGIEVENMTPENAERALYSDILNLSIAQKEYQQLSGVLGKITNTFQVKDLLAKVFDNQTAKNKIINQICNDPTNITVGDPNMIKEFLLEQNAKDLSSLLIEGVPINRNNLTNFLSDERFSIRPLHNFFFTRDASMTCGNEVLIGKMANAVRDREAMVMKAIFDYIPEFKATTVDPLSANNPAISIEGGDVLVARDDIFVIGTGTRTTSQGIDFILSKLIAQGNEKRHIIVQELPHTPESFIHMDMVFTLLDKDKCMVYEPLILKPNKYQTIIITAESGKVTSINHEVNVVEALRKLRMDLEPVFCGGNDSWNQEREQWHSGANFFAVAPGKVVGYGRNIHTIEAMNNAGFDIVPANDIISGKTTLDKHNKCVITLEGSELPRGGGGARCMTMPIRRKSVNW